MPWMRLARAGPGAGGKAMRESTPKFIAWVVLLGITTLFCLGLWCRSQDEWAEREFEKNSKSTEIGSVVFSRYGAAASAESVAMAHRAPGGRHDFIGRGM